MKQSISNVLNMCFASERVCVWMFVFAAHCCVAVKAEFYFAAGSAAWKSLSLIIFTIPYGEKKVETIVQERNGERKMLKFCY